MLPAYPGDVTDAEWDLLSPLLPPAKPGGQPRSVDLRRIVTGTAAGARTTSGCAPWPRRSSPSSASASSPA